MKKIIAIIIAATLILAIVGCSKSQSETSKSITETSLKDSMGTSIENSNAQSSFSQQNTSQNQNSLSNSQTSNVNSSSQVHNASSSVDNGNSGTITTQGTIHLISYYGALESAVLTWQKSSFSDFNVYYKTCSSSDYIKIDSSLVREYVDYYRADVLGLPKGDYDVKVVGVSSGSENSQSASIAKINVQAHTREGFAFSTSSPNKTASGAYNDNGSLKADAKVLYVTSQNANTIKYTGKVSASKSEERTGLVNIMALRQKGYDKTPLAIRFIGKIDSTNITGLNEKNYLQVKGCYNVTLEGVGNDATCYGWSMLVRDANNVEIRNFGIMLFLDDGISMDTDNFNIWVHNNDIYYGKKGSDADQFKGDGSCDNKKSSYITVSYNHFWDSGKSILCGMTDEPASACITFHHNWFDHSDSRHPRIRIGTVHVYNNFYDCVAKYGIGATMGSSCFAESNYFYNTKNPMLISLQGHDAISANFSGETGGMIKSFGNIFEACSAITDQTQNATSFDCYTVLNKSDIVPSSVKTLSGGTSYNNFDTQSTMYAYVPTSAQNVPSEVKANSGRMNSDFTFVFTAADTTSYSLNQPLMDAILAYQTKLVAVK